jgi:hypothetical protein
MKWIRCFTLAKGLLLALLAAGLSTGLASAQDCEGTFTLPFEARWGLATLAPGNYSFRLEATGSLHFVTIRHGLKAAAMVVEDGRNTYESAAGPSALIAVRSGGKYRITRLRLAEAGLVLNYLPPKAERQILAQGPVLTRHVPILMAAR